MQSAKVESRILRQNMKALLSGLALRFKWRGSLCHTVKTVCHQEKT